MKIGFAPCGFTSKEIIQRLIALGGINRAGYNLVDTPTNLYWFIDSISGEIRCYTGNVLDKKLNPNDHKEVIKSLEDLPSEIKGLIKQRQIDAGNKADLTVFRHIGADKYQGGFTWKDTPEGSAFWDDLLSGKYFLYYTLNCKQNEIKLQGEETSIGRSKDITGSGIRCERRKPTIAGGHLRNRKTIKF